MTITLDRIAYGIRRTVPLGYDEAVAKARAALAAEGFGVMCEIDIAAKLKEKLGVDYRRYVILGACNPPLAYKALLTEPDLGLLLPCNVVVYEEGDHCVVGAIDAQAMLAFTGNEKLREVASEVKARLERVVAAV